MKKTLAGAVLLAAAFAAPAALNAYRTGITLPQAVRLADGSVLPAGKYDVQIDFKGFGNAAEFHFFQGGVFKGKAPAEARGFSSQAPAGNVHTAKVVDKRPDPDSRTDKTSPLDTEQKGFPKVEAPGAGTPQTFSWGAHGFNPGLQGKALPTGQGSLKLSFDSANSAAGFSAILPYVEKARK